jgi:hypothetical protein
MVNISLDHPYRLRTIADSAIAFLRDAAFVVESSSNGRESLTGRLDLRNAGARLRLLLRNDVLDMTIMAAGAAQGPSFGIGEVERFADVLRVNLNRIVALIERGNLTALRTRMDASFAQRSTEFLRQKRAYQDAKRASHPKPRLT